MIDPLNRFVLWILGCALLAAAVVALLARADSSDIDLREPGRIYDDAAREVSATPRLWWPIIIGVAICLLVVGVLWLRALFVRRGGRGIGTQTIERHDLGRVDLDPAPLGRAVAADLRTIDGVHGSAVRLLELKPTAVVIARLDLVRGTDPRHVQGQTEAVFDRLRTVVGADHVDAELRIRMAADDGARVV